MDNEFNTFMVGNREVSYDEVKTCIGNVDAYGNPKYELKLENGEPVKLTGVQAFAFDRTRVRGY